MSVKFHQEPCLFELKFCRTACMFPLPFNFEHERKPCCSELLRWHSPHFSLLVTNFGLAFGLKLGQQQLLLLVLTVSAVETLAVLMFCDSNSD